jgi:hypothetical protein
MHKRAWLRHCLHQTSKHLTLFMCVQSRFQNFDDAQALYEDLMARDPYRLEVRLDLTCTYMHSHTHTLLSWAMIHVSCIVFAT